MYQHVKQNHWFPHRKRYPHPIILETNSGFSLNIAETMTGSVSTTRDNAQHELRFAMLPRPCRLRWAHPVALHTWPCPAPRPRVRIPGWERGPWSQGWDILLLRLTAQGTGHPRPELRGPSVGILCPVWPCFLSADTCGLVIGHSCQWKEALTWRPFRGCGGRWLLSRKAAAWPSGVHRSLRKAASC